MSFISRVLTHKVSKEAPASVVDRETGISEQKTVESKVIEDTWKRYSIQQGKQEVGSVERINGVFVFVPAQLRPKEFYMNMYSSSYFSPNINYETSRLIYLTLKELNDCPD